MKTNSKKRLLFVMLAGLLFVLPFVGCGDDDFLPVPDNSQTESTPEPIPVLTVWIDNSDLWTQTINTDKLWEAVEGNGREFFLQTEILGNEEPQRGNRLSQMRVELMAGKGPDIFLCSTGGGGSNGLMGYDQEKNEFYSLGRTFPFPEQAMRNHIFLTLDQYIQKQAKRMEWEKLDPVIMKAGRTEEGQQLLPMGYSMFVSLYDRSVYSLDQSRFPMTHQEMLESEDLLLVNTALGADIWTVCSQSVDYEHDTLGFTEEQFLQNVTESLDDSFQEEHQGDFPEGTFVNCWLGQYGQQDLTNKANGLGDEDPEYWMVPRYNDAGGITANVTSYAAINRNTPYPEYAFRVLDTLLAKSTQQNSQFYQTAVEGIPVYMDLGTREEPVTKSGGQWYMSEWNHRQFELLHGQINSVYFSTPLEEQVSLMWQEYRQNGRTPEALEKAAKKAYSTMRMMVGES